MENNLSIVPGDLFVPIITKQDTTILVVSISKIETSTDFLMITGQYFFVNGTRTHFWDGPFYFRDTTWRHISVSCTGA